MPNDTNKIAPITQNGYYQVQVTDSNGCQLISDSLQVTSASINELNKSIVIYPNPTQGEFIIMGDEITGSLYSIKDVSGKLIISAKIKGNKEHINLSQFKRGLYFLEIEGVTASKRIILN